MGGRVNLSRPVECSLATTLESQPFGRRVYGVWTEKPNKFADVEARTGDEHSGSHGTIVNVGVADFGDSPTKP